jgi:hypothetical protein
MLQVIWSRIDGAPESLLHSQVEINGDWNTWMASKPAKVLSSELEWEAAEFPCYLHCAE